MKLNESHKKILAEILLACIQNGITLMLANSPQVKLADESDKFKSRGFFDEEARLLAVGTKNTIEIWFLTLLHEYNHMRQWIEGKFISQKYNDASYDFWEWLDGNIELDSKRVREVYELVREFEKDCEIRTWKMLCENPGISNPDKYVRRANSYMYFYTMSRRLRKWCKKPPYMVSQIIEIMPNYFLDDYNRVPVILQQLMTEHCF